MSENLRPGAQVARGTIYILVVTHAFEKETELLGIYATLNLILTVVLVFGTFALPSASTKYIAQYIAEEKPEKAKSIVSRILQISLFTCVAVFIAISFLATFLSSSLLGGLTYVSLFYLLAVTSVLNLLYTQLAAFVQGSQRILQLAIIISIYTVLQNVVGICLLSIGWGLWGIAVGWVAGLLPSVLLGLFYTGKFVGVSKNFHPMRPLIKFSFPLYLSHILSFFVGWVDQILILFLLSAMYGLTEAQRVLGLYYIAVRASAVPNLVASSLVTTLFPKLSELYAQGGNISLRNAFRAITRYASLIGFPVIIGLATLSYPIMNLFAPALKEAAWPLTILCLAALPSALGVAVGPILLSQERIKAASLISVFTVISEAAVSFVLLIPLGMSGAALSRVVASILSFVLGVFVLRKSMGIGFDKEALWKSSVSSILMVLGVVSLDFARLYFLFGAIHVDQIFNFPLRLLPIYVFVGALVYFTSSMAFKAIKKHDVDLLRDYLPKGFKWIATWFSRIIRVK